MIKIEDTVRQRVIVQASSKSWEGGRDLCMAIVDGKPIIYKTIKQILDYIPNSEVKVAAPAFDRKGKLESLLHAFPAERLSIYYGHDSSPMNRILDICEDLEKDDYIIRIDGLNFCFDTSASLKMLNQARLHSLDCVKLPDDFPVQLTSDIYRVGALRTLENILEKATDAVFKVHPKFYMFMRKDIFHCAYALELPSYADDYLKQCREIAKAIYDQPRLEVNESDRIWSGDQLSFHYELALDQCQPWMKILDIGCGNGWGARMLAPKVAEVHGADLDPEVVSQARVLTKVPNVKFHVEDITNMTFGSGEFDVVCSMETIEHVDEESCLRQIKRVLKPGGILVLSTPQNRMGHIPVNPQHLREYNLENLVKLCEQHFTIKHVIGIKSGRIVIPGDPYGTNTVVVCQKTA